MVQRQQHSLPGMSSFLFCIYVKAGLYLFDNCLTGTIPSEVGRLTNLSEFSNVSSAAISTSVSSFPCCIFKLLHLDALWLLSNTLTGTIPSEIGLFTDLVALNLYTNNLIGTIPSEIGLLTKLGECYVALDRSFFL